MIELSHSTPSHARAASAAPGGFLWWYADIRDHQGNGAVLIWSLGLPFLPGSRERLPPEARPSMVLALYNGGRPSGYLLQEYGSADAELDPSNGSGSIGSSAYEIKEEGLQIVVTATLDEPMPSSRERLVGCVTLRGPRIELGSAQPSTVHSWGPRALHARGLVDLLFGRERARFEGSGYFDSNVSTVPLQDQKICSWRWGRLSFPEYSIAFYEVLEGDGSVCRYLVRQTQEGQFTELAGRLTFSRWARGRYGLTAPREGIIQMLRGEIRFEVTSVVDDSPFYGRFLTQGVDERGRRGVGISEVVVPHKIDEPWQRPFVRMRTHRVGRENSPWLPLFSGPVPGRAGRLLRSLSGQRLSS